MKEINKDCPCTSSCSRHGDCDACKENHKDGLTFCQRLEKDEK